MFRLLFECNADAIWLFDPDAGAFVDCNEAAVTLMRAETKMQLLQTWPGMLVPDNRRASRSETELTELPCERGAQRFEGRVCRLDGTEIPVEISATPVSAHGRTLHVLVCRDITVRQQAEAGLRESQQLLASVVDNISEAVYRTGPDHELIFANRAYLRMSGYDSFEEMQRLPRERLYANPADRARLLERLARDGGFRNEEIEYIRHDGQHWWGLTHSVAIRHAETGAVLYHVGSVADITERRQAQQAVLELNATLERRIAARTAELTASEARLRTLVEHAPEAIVVFDGDTGRFISGNAHACRLYGREAGELWQLTPADVSPELQADGRRSTEVAREHMTAALAGATPVFEWVHRHASGRLIPTEVRLVRLPAEGRRLLRASIIDNTRRKRREAIQQATFKISEAVHTAGDLDALFPRIHTIVRTLMPADNFYIALADLDHDAIEFPYMVDEAGVDASPLPMNAGWTGYVLRSGKPLLAGRHNAVTPDGLTVQLENGEQVVATACGARPAAVWLGAPLTVRGRTIGVAVVQDYQDPRAYGEEEKQILTFVAGQIALAIERKRSEQALRESEAKFRVLFEASSAGVMLHDETQYLEVNPAAARILGYASPVELVGKNPRDTSPPTQPGGEDSDTLARRHIADCLARGSTRFDWVARHVSGRDVPLEVILTRIEWGGRQIIQAVLHDISGRKQVETELLRALAREKELGQLKSNFVSMISHEFRTPLGIILSSAELLEGYFDQLEAHERREQLESIQKQSHRMAALMEEALLLGQFEAGKLEFKPVPLELRLCCRRLVDEVLSATDRQCPIRLVDHPLPGPAYADERLLRHIFHNLLTNAVKYSAPGTPVEFQVALRDTHAVFVIRDAGIGIPDADREWLFEAFHRGRNVGDRPGTGLGLTIVKRCVALHGGTIKIESRLGEGTTVTVALPVFPGDAGPEI
jgi:PAS domain S-box-containing protein